VRDSVTALGVASLGAVSLLGLFGCAEENEAPGAPPPAVQSDAGPKVVGLGDYVAFPASGVRIRRPDGFERPDSFDGFGSEETQASILAASVPGPYAQVSAGFTRDEMRERGWTLRSRDDVEVEGLKGILVRFEQPAGGEVFSKWALVFGDERTTTMVTATVPRARAQDVAGRLEAALSSVRLHRGAPSDPGADLPFTLTPSPKLRPAPGIGRTLVYTEDGVVPVKSFADPLFVAAPSVGSVVVTDRRSFAEGRLRETAATKGLVVKSTEAVAIDGLDGYESLAEAQDATSGTPLVVHQVILFDEGSYVLLQGIVGTDLRDEYLPEFRAMARSLKRKER
jgi:hypothetical protein